MTPNASFRPFVRPLGAPPTRPREAAALIVYRRSRDAIEVLMGERHRRHKFFPQRYVFPGGGIDRADGRVRLASPLRAHVAAQLERKQTASRARATAVAAVRETFEETGLILGAPDPAPGTPVPPGWRPFFATGSAPALGRLDYVARAVTPPFHPIRFDARFFMIDGRHVAGELAGSGELLDLRWFGVWRALDLELANITRRVLAHAAGLIVDPPPARDRPIPYFKQIVDEFVRIDE